MGSTLKPAALWRRANIKNGTTSRPIFLKESFRNAQ